MRLLIQKVKRAAVAIEGERTRRIGRGLCVFIAVNLWDDESDVEWIAEKLVHLRVFDNEEGRMSLSLLDTAGEVLLVSQFTLYANCRKGRRPSFGAAATGEAAERLYNLFVERVRQLGVKKVVCGTFGAHMEISLLNDGPFTVILDSPYKDRSTAPVNNADNQDRAGSEAVESRNENGNESGEITE